MPLTTKIVLIIIAVLIFSSIGFVVYKSYQMTQQQAAINKSMVEMKQLQDNIARSQAQYVSKDDLNSFAQQNNLNLTQIQKDLGTLSATVTSINEVSIHSNGSNGTNIPSTNTTPSGHTEPVPTVNCNGQTINCPTTDPNSYYANVQNLQLTEPFSGANVPVGQVAFDASKPAPWSYNIYPRSYDISTVIGTDNDGRHYVYNKFSITSNGKVNSLKITNAKYEEEYPSPSFSFWNPHVFLGVDGGLGVSSLPLKGEFTPNLSFGFLSYGKTKVSPDWIFGDVGVGYGVVDKKLQFQIMPAQYNLGRVLPFISNTYVGPVLGVGIDGVIYVGGGVRVGL